MNYIVYEIDLINEKTEAVAMFKYIYQAKEFVKTRREKFGTILAWKIKTI